MASAWPSASYRTVFCSSREEIGSFGAFLGLLGVALMKDFPFWPFSRSHARLALIAHEKLPQILDLGFPSSIFTSCAKKKMTLA